MKDKVVLSAILQYGFVTGTFPVRRRRLNYDRASAIGHGLTSLIDIWTSNFARPAYCYFVSAVHTLATYVKRNEQVVIPAMPDQERRFHRPVNRRGAGTSGQRVHIRIVIRQFAGLRVNPTHLDSAPETTPSQPVMAFVFHE